MTIPLPDSSILHDVLRLCDSVPIRARQPARPRCYCPADDTLDREPREIADLREHLRVLPDDHQAQVHASVLGRPRVRAAVTRTSTLDFTDTPWGTDLDASGAAYLAGKAALGEGLQRGLQELGLLPDSPAALRTLSSQLTGGSDVMMDTVIGSSQPTWPGPNFSRGGSSDSVDHDGQ